MSFLDNLPFFFNNKIDSKIQNSLYLEAETLHNENDNTLDQFFVETSTWGLDYWEKMLGIKKNNFDMQTRRENIKAKMRSRGTSTVKVIKNICESYANGEVDIIENPNDYSFVIEFVGSKGVPLAFDELDKVVNKIKPCHLAHTYKFRYTTYKELEPFTHSQLAQYTHDEIRNGALRGVDPIPPTDVPPIEIDNPPSISYINNLNVYVNETFAITYIAKDDKEIVRHEFFDGNRWTDKEVSVENDTYTFSHIFRNVNTNKCKVRVTDSKGQTATSNVFNVVSIERPVVDHPPTVSQDIANQEGYVDEDYTIAYIAKDDKAIVKHEFFDGSRWITKINTSRTVSKDGDNYYMNVRFEDEGLKSCQIRVTDSKGQTAISNVFSFNIHRKVVEPPPVVPEPEPPVIPKPPAESNSITIRHLDDCVGVDEGWYGITCFITSEFEIKSYFLSYDDGATWEDFSPSDYMGGKFGYIYATTELQICKIKVVDVKGNEKTSNSFKLQAKAKK